MTTPLSGLSVPTSLQTVRSIGVCLGKAVVHCSEVDIDPDDFAESRPVPDLAPFWLQTESMDNYSVWGLDAIRRRPYGRNCASRGLRIPLGNRLCFMGFRLSRRRAIVSTRMNEEDWVHRPEVFRACLPRCGRKAANDRLFLKAMHVFTVENVRWRALPEQFGLRNSVWKRFERVALRRKKTARNYRSIVSFAAGLCLIKFAHTA